MVHFFEFTVDKKMDSVAERKGKYLVYQKMTYRTETKSNLTWYTLTSSSFVDSANKPQDYIGDKTSVSHGKITCPSAPPQ